MSLYNHPNATDWWEWPITLSPLWLYARNLPGGMLSTISAMGNPVLWWVGLAAVISSLVDGYHRKWPYLFLGVLYVCPAAPLHFHLPIPLHLPLLRRGPPYSHSQPRGSCTSCGTSPGSRKYILLLLASRRSPSSPSSTPSSRGRHPRLVHRLPAGPRNWRF